jgi:hypothetical protein
MAEGFLGGLGDFVTGGGVYSDPKAINPTYGVPEGDVRQAAINQLGQMSALLLAAGQPMEGSQRAQLLSQIGGTGNQFNTNLYNAAQRRLMTSQMQEKQRETEELNVLRDLQQKDPEGLAKRLGPNYTAEIVKSMPAGSLRDIVKSVTVAQLSRDPIQQQAAALSAMKTQRELNTPVRQEIGGKLYEYDEGAKKWNLVAAGNPPGGLEGESQALILRGMRDPAFVETPEYSIAYSRLYGPKTEIRNGEVVQIQPSIPSGVVQPRVAATAMPSAPQAPAPAPQQGQATPPAVVQPPTGGETRTITTPGGGSVSVTSTQPRALSAAEMGLKSETEASLQGLRAAESSLREALTISPQAYAGPLASQRGAAAGVTNVDPSSAVATRQFNNIMTEQALSQLRAIFGGNPTEGERKILLDIQAGANMSRPEREALLRRAIETVQTRVRDTERRLSEVSRGEYGRVQSSGSGVPPSASAPPLPPGFQVVR